MNTFENYPEIFTQWLGRLGYAEATGKSYKQRLESFLLWLKTKHIHNLDEIDQPHFGQFKTHLEQRTNINKKSGGLGLSYIQSHINTIKLFSRYLQLTEGKPILTTEIKVNGQKTNQTIVLTKPEIKQMYEATDNSPGGYRDRAILAIFYACGLRSGEGLRLEPNHIHYGKGLLYVAPGKNNRSRFVPMNETTMQHLKEYEQYGRSLTTTTNKAFFLNTRGTAITANCINNRIKYLADQSGINKRVYTHLLRHSIATHLLQEGMEIESISQFLGHTTLEATQIYAHLAAETPTETENQDV